MIVDKEQVEVLIRLAALEAKVGALRDTNRLRELHDKEEAKRRLRALEIRVYGRVQDHD